MGGSSGLYFDLNITFAFASWDSGDGKSSLKIRPRIYQYRLLDYDLRELLVYHWQPGPEFAGPDHPHLHVSAALTARTDAVTERRIDLDKLHLATGLVSPPVIVRMLITEFGVQARQGDWATTLDRAESTLARIVTT